MPKGVAILGKQVRALRDARYMTQATLARCIQSSIETVKRIESLPIASVGAEKIPLLGLAFGMNLHEVKAALVVLGETRSSETRLATADALSPGGVSATGSRQIPIYHGVSAVRTDVRDPVEAGHVAAAVDADFAVVARGECMEPRIRDGEIVCCSIRRWQQAGFIWGQAYWIRFADGQSTLKTVLPDTAAFERFVCQPTNPSVPSFTRDKSEVDVAAQVVAILLR